MGKPIVHWEIVSNGPAKDVMGFYSDLFGWNIYDDNPIGYGMVGADEAGGVAGGIFGSTDPNIPGHVTVYVEVDDPNAVLADIEERGGKTIMPPTEVVPGTTIAMFSDPWGSIVGLRKA